MAATRETVDAPALPRPSRRHGWRRDGLRRRLLAGADAAAVVGASLVLGIVPGNLWEQAIVGTAVAGLWVLLAKVYGLYDRDHRALRVLTADELPRMLAWSTSGTAVTSVLLAGLANAPTAGDAIRMWILTTVGVVVLRTVARHLWRQVTPPENTLIVGRRSLRHAVERKLGLFPDLHLNVVGVVEDRSLARQGSEHEAIEAMILRCSAGRSVDRIILSASTANERLIADLLRYCRRSQVKLGVIPPASGMFGTAVELDHLAEMPVVQYNTWDIPRSTLLLKRTLDVVASASALLVLAPLLLALAIVVRLDSSGRALFVQRRAGYHGRPFSMLKFRTMDADAEARLRGLVSLESLPEPVFKLHGDPRITRVGRTLRRLSLDELPQLINVLRGDMSLVGPRPEQVELVERYEPEHRIRLEVKPGLTGPMQVFGRGELSLEERVAVEREYVENLTLGRDLRILLMTGSAVVRGRGAF